MRICVKLPPAISVDPRMKPPELPYTIPPWRCTGPWSLADASSASPARLSSPTTDRRYPAVNTRAGAADAATDDADVGSLGDDAPAGPRSRLPRWSPRASGRPATPCAYRRERGSRGKGWRRESSRELRSAWVIRSRARARQERSCWGFRMGGRERRARERGGSASCWRLQQSSCQVTNETNVRFYLSHPLSQQACLAAWKQREPRKRLSAPRDGGPTTG